VRTWGARLALVLLGVALGGQAAAQSIYLELVGDKGAISALSGQPGMHSDETPIVALAGNLYVEDLGAMQLSKRPLRLEKVVDAASPRLLEALSTFENITTCVVRLYQNVGMGDALYFQIDFTNPVIVGLTASASDAGGFPHEVISIGYDAITYTYTPVAP